MKWIIIILICLSLIGCGIRKNDMSYIKLIKELKTDWDDSFYIDSPYLGVAYGYEFDPNIIGTYKGTPTSDTYWFVPFKKTPDQRTYRGEYPRLHDHLFSAGDKYASLYTTTNDRYVEIYPYMWDDDKPEYDYQWELHRSNIYCSAPDPRGFWGMFDSLNNYYLAEKLNFNLTTTRWGNYISNWNQDSELFTIEISKSYEYQYPYKPSFSSSYFRTTLSVTASYTLVDTVNDRINKVNYFRDGDEVKYASTGTPIGGLTIANWYYIVNSTSDSFQLSDTKGGSPIDLTSQGTGEHSFRNLVFASPSDVDITNDVINKENKFQNNYRVYYNTTGATIGGLTNNSYYFIVNCTSDSFQLSSTSGGSPIDLTSQGSGSFSFVLAYVDFTLSFKTLDYDTKRFHIQVASDSDFSNLLEDYTQDVALGYTYESTTNSIHKYIYAGDTKYVRIRGEWDNDNYSDWTSTIILDYGSPQTYNYSGSYTGDYTTRVVLGAVKRGNYIDVIERVTIMPSGSNASYYFYLNTYDLNADLISSNLLKDSSVYLDRIMVINDKTYIIYSYSSSTTHYVSEFDGNDVITKELPNPPDNWYFVDELFQDWGSLVVIFTYRNSNWTDFKIYSWNWETETATEMNLPIGVYGGLSNTFDGKGFWFEFDDGTYCGIAFYYLEGINRAMSFIQFQRNMMGGG